MPECVCVVGGQAATCRLRGDAWGAPLAELTSGMGCSGGQPGVYVLGGSKDRELKDV